MDAKLVVVAGDAEATEVKLRLPAILGRGREATLTVPHPLVSRQHCEIFENDGFLVVRDLGSLNGTFIGDERIDSEAVLRDGELLTVGTVTFRAVYLDDPNLTAPARPEDASESERVAAPVAAAQPATPRVSGVDEEGETERVQPPGALPAEDDLEFAEFLQSMDVEAESVDEEVEQSAEVEVAPTIDISSPRASTDVDKAEQAGRVEEPPLVDDDFEPVEDVSSVGGDSDVEVEEVEEVEEVGEVEAVEVAEMAESVRPDEPSPEVAAQASDAGEAESGKETSDAEDDELKSFLRELDI